MQYLMKGSTPTSVSINLNLTQRQDLIAVRRRKYNYDISAVNRAITMHHSGHARFKMADAKFALIIHVVGEVIIGLMISY